MDFILAGFIGYCGSGPHWPHRSRWLGRDRSVDPVPNPWRGSNDPQPLPWRNHYRIWGPIVGAASGIILVYFLGSYYAGAGMLGTVVLGFAGGRVGSQLIGDIGGLIFKGEQKR